MLAGLPQAPSLYDPKQNPQSAFARQHYVLSGLVATGKITQQQADDVDPLVGGSNASDALLAKQQANQQSLQNELNHGKQIARLGSAPHFVQYVRDQLQQRFADDPSVTQGDLTVTTTLDLSIQAKANDAVAKGVAGIGRDANNGALLMIDSHTGDITAMVGSADYSDNSIAGQYNVVTGQRRPGSSFKPYVYETGFINGRIKPSTVLDDTPAESAKLGNVHDYDNRYQGRITAATALLESRNIPAEQAMVMAGVPDVINFAHSLGITSTLSDNPSTAIGTSTVRMIDHAAAYAAFSNYGHKLTPRAILKVVDGNGNTLVNEPTPSPGTQVMTQAQAYAITKILRNYPSHWGIHFNRPIASKSGTTDNYIDAYYMSYSPDYVVAAWAGHTSADGHEQGMKTVYGNDVGKYISAPFVNGLPGPGVLRGQRRADRLHRVRCFVVGLGGGVPDPDPVDHADAAAVRDLFSHPDPQQRADRHLPAAADPAHRRVADPLSVGVARPDQARGVPGTDTTLVSGARPVSLTLARLQRFAERRLPPA
jgi:membrane peptidoglycan carboxypeptidase